MLFKRDTIPSGFYRAVLIGLTHCVFYRAVLIGLTHCGFYRAVLIGFNSLWFL